MLVFGGVFLSRDLVIPWFEVTFTTFSPTQKGHDYQQNCPGWMELRKSTIGQLGCVNQRKQGKFQGPPIMGPPYGKLPIPFPYL